MDGAGVKHRILYLKILSERVNLCSKKHNIWNKLISRVPLEDWELSAEMGSKRAFKSICIFRWLVVVLSPILIRPNPGVCCFWFPKINDEIAGLSWVSKLLFGLCLFPMTQISSYLQRRAENKRLKLFILFANFLISFVRFTFSLN